MSYDMNVSREEILSPSKIALWSAVHVAAGFQVAVHGNCHHGFNSMGNADA